MNSKNIREKWYLFALILLLCIIPLQALTSVREKSIYGDEVAQICSGYSKLKTLDYRIAPEHGPLFGMIASFPLLFMDVSFPFDHPSYQVKNLDVLMPVFVFEYNDNPYEIMFWARLPVVLLSMLLGFYVFKWAKELFGEKAGLFALFLYVLSPNMIGFGRIISNDFGFLVFGFIATYYYWRFLREPTAARLLVSGLTLGVVQLTKFTAISLFPLYVLLGVVFVFGMYKPKNKIKFVFANVIPKRLRKHKYAFVLVVSFAVLLVMSYLIILVGYKAEGVGKPITESMREDIHLNKSLFPVESYSESGGVMGYALSNIPSPLPYYYVRGIGASVYYSSRVSETSIINGKLVNDRLFFIKSFLTKTPIALLIFVLIFLISVVLSKDRVDELFLILPFLFFHALFLFMTKQLGYRYVIFTIPFIFVGVSKVVKLNFSRKNIGKLVLAGLCLWYLVSSVSIYPHYLSYFNEFVGPENGYKHFVNSNVDWGQDLLLLVDYLESNGIEEVKLSYYGFPVTGNYPLPDYYDFSYQELGCGPTDGIIAISATNLWSSESCYGWLTEREPDERIGYSILVYNISNTS